jgi:hypothetical protein
MLLGVSEMAVPGIGSINATRSTGWNQLYCDSLRNDSAFIPDHVHVAAA